MSYDDFSEHVIMLQDSVRTLAYERAIREVVRPGMTVLDFGCGTGVLSLFAARAGAERVYAVDKAAIVHAAEAIARRNGCKQISFIRTEGEGFTLPEKVDVLVSEWMGIFVLRENMMPALLSARDAHLRPGGVMIPRAVGWSCAFIIDEAFYRERAFFDDRPYGIDFSLVRDWAFADVQWRSLTPSQLSIAFPLQSLDIAAAQREPDCIQGATSFPHPVTAYGICGWFDAQLSEGEKLDTSPSAPPTHWKQLLFPFARPVVLAADDKVSVDIRPVRAEGRRMSWRWSVKAARETVWYDDFSYRAHLLTK